MTTASADEVYREVMTLEPPPTATPQQRQAWSRPGLGRRERRWVTLVVASFDNEQPALDEQVYAALNSGDISLAEMLEFVLHFAVYCGWPKGSRLEGTIREQWARIEREQGRPVADWPDLDNDSLGLSDWEARLQRGEKEFADVNFVPAPARNTPYQQAGILNFVFGHVWMRPGLGWRDRRFITVACVVVAETPIPIMSHVGSALHSGQITRAEMDEVIAQFTAYAGQRRGDLMSKAVEDGLFEKMLNR
jgi:4-carboxymuconolactone decarboxylase